MQVFLMASAYSLLLGLTYNDTHSFSKFTFARTVGTFQLDLPTPLSYWTPLISQNSVVVQPRTSVLLQI